MALAEGKHVALGLFEYCGGDWAELCTLVCGGLCGDLAFSCWGTEDKCPWGSDDGDMY